MTLARGFYSLRNGDFAHITAHTPHSLYGYVLGENKRMRYWTSDGDEIDHQTEYDLMEYLKVKENGSHEGPSIHKLFEEKKERKK